MAIITISNKDGSAVMQIPVDIINLLEKKLGKKLTLTLTDKSFNQVNRMLFENDEVRKKLQEISTKNLKDMGLSSLVDDVRKDNKD